MTWTPSILRIDRRGMASVVAAAIVVVVACTTGTALDKDDGGTPRPVASVDVTPSLTTLTQVGATVQLHATVKDDLGDVVTGRTVQWHTSRPDVATISASGLARAVGAGTATLTGTVDTKVGSATVDVTIAARPIASVEVTPGTGSLTQAGATVQLSATVRDDAGAVVTGRTIAWSSSNTSVATVSAGGLVTAVASGTATVSGTVDSKVGNSTITVTIAAPRPVASVELSPATVTLTQAGATSQLSGTVRDDAGAVVSGRTIAWSSSNTAAATVNSSGLVTAVANGTATISGTVDSRTGTSSVTVSIAPRPIGSVTLSPLTATLTQAGATVQLNATVRDDAGTVVTGRTVTWASSNTAAATVSSSGLVTAVASGSSTVTGTVDGKTGSAGITVSIAAPGTSFAILAAGDIASCSHQGDEATARILDALPGLPILLPGDVAYPDGTAEDFRNCFEPSWGRHKSRIWPVPGNHEYHVSGATPYFDYFGSRAGEPGKGYYSFDLGGWHIIGLNSNISMGSSSAQIAWLKADLAANTAKCTIAFFHRARWSSGHHGTSTTPKAAVDALYAANADLLLVGHDHHYERFAPQDMAGAVDLVRGMRQFVVGTGGGGFSELLSPEPNSEVRIANTYGLLKLTLKADSYDWEFIPIAGSTATDSGTSNCH